MAAARTFLRKYWIFLVIVLWVIAWANRDWLAGGLPPAEDAPAESARAAEIAEPALQSESTPSASGDSVDEVVTAADPDLASRSDSAAMDTDTSAHGAPPRKPTAQRKTAAGSGSEEDIDRPTEEVMPVAASDSTTVPRKSADAKTTEVEEEAGSEPAPASTDPARSGSDAPVATNGTPVRADAGTEVEVRDSRKEPAAVAESEGEDGESADAPVAETSPDSVADTGSTERQADVLARARSLARSRGPNAAAEAMAQDLRKLPSTTPGLADLYGEMGNYHFMARNFTAALAAYDAAIQTLPAKERNAMLRRLAPVYDRYHPDGRSHLEQFR